MATADRVVIVCPVCGAEAVGRPYAGATTDSYYCPVCEKTWTVPRPPGRAGPGQAFSLVTGLKDGS